jgi:hypothetical protein
MCLAVPSCNVAGSDLREELLFEKKRLRNDGTDAARTEQPSQDGNEMDEKNTLSLAN